jgi:hypothetical protein
VFEPILEPSGLSFSVPRGLYGSEVDGARVGSCRGCLASSLLGDDVFSYDLLVCLGVLQVMRWSVLEKVPRVTALWGHLFLEARLPWFGKVPPDLSFKSSQKGVGPFGLMPQSLVTPRGVVLHRAHPYPRSCQLLRRLAFPWWRRIGSLRAAYYLHVGRGNKSFSPVMKRSWSLEFGNLLVGGHDTYHHALPGGVPYGAAASNPVILVCCLVPGRIPGSMWLVAPRDPFRIVGPFLLFESGGAISSTGYPALVVWLPEESVVSRLLGRNRRPTVPRVQDPDTIIHQSSI